MFLWNELNACFLYESRIAFDRVSILSRMPNSKLQFKNKIISLGQLLFYQLVVVFDLLIFSNLRPFMKKINRLLAACQAKFSYKKPNKPWYDPKAHTQTRKKSSYLHFAIYGLMFAGCFAAIPIYRIFCEHVGLVGDYTKKQYDFKGKKITNVRKYRVNFTGEPQPGINWEFTPLQPEVYVNAAETAIVFYKIYNKEDYPIIGFSTYNVTPQLASLYFSKIQCFCFNQQLINPKQELLLPLFFYLQPQINEDPNISRIDTITIDYRFYKSDRQDLAKHVEKELKQLELNRKALAKIRADKAGLTMEEYEKKYGADQSGTEARLHGILDEVTEETQSETPETLQAEPETAK